MAQRPAVGTITCVRSRAGGQRGVAALFVTVMLCFAMVSLAIGIVWMRNVVKVEV